MNRTVLIPTHPLFLFMTPRIISKVFSYYSDTFLVKITRYLLPVVNRLSFTKVFANLLLRTVKQSVYMLFPVPLLNSLILTKSLVHAGDVVN